ncbi:MAG: hypothetical protein N3D85_02130 [Candidatus Bathyarchaeota archaeon]|nr:hypothetical protein [Candidatus Bathyarchaeota archaeon]
MPVPQALVSRYFQLIANRQFTESERELENIKQAMPKTEWNRGYFRALYGIYLAQKNNDSYSFFSKLDLFDKTTLHAYRREFLDHTRNSLHGDFDRGYFSAWADCMRVLVRLEISAPQTANAEAAAPEKTQLETLRTDKSQATIANFLKEKLDNAEKE